MRTGARVTMPRHLQTRLTWARVIRALTGLALAGLWLTAIVMVVR
jgi:hypothetical protein